MTDPNGNLRHRFDFGASPSWTSFSANSSSQKGSTSADSFQSSPSRSLPGSYIPSAPENHASQEPPPQYNTTAPELEPLNARYATTVEEVPDVEEEYVERPEEPVRQTGTQNVERTCRICLSGAEDGIGSQHLCSCLYSYVCTCLSCPLMRLSAFPSSRGLFGDCRF